MKTRTTVLPGIGALVVLLVGIVAIPVLLLTITGSPLSQIGSSGDLHDALTNPISDHAVIVSLTFACWVLWLLFSASVVHELVNWMRDADSRPIPLTGVLARRLILSVALFFANGQRPTASLTDQLTPISITYAAETNRAPAQSSAADAAETPNTVDYTVAPRDDLWGLAERHLGDPLRWREIFELNKGTPQPDGRSLTSPGLLRPGWVLKLPDNATGLSPSTLAEGQMDVPPGNNSALPINPPTTVTRYESQTNESKAAPPLTLKEDHSDQTSFVKWSLVASGMLFCLDQIRRRRRRHRTPGMIDAEIPEALRRTEVAMRFANQTSPATRLNIATRALAQCLTNLPAKHTSINAVRIGEDGIEFLFDSPAFDSSGLFRVDADGHSWTLESTVHEVRVGALAAEMPSPLPALVEVGTLDRAHVLIDLESHGITSITGSDAELLAQSLVQQLSTSMWADHIEIVAVDIPGPHGLNRVRLFDSLSEVPSLVCGIADDLGEALDESGYASTLQARTSMGGSDGWIPTVIFVKSDETDAPKFQDFVATARNGGRGLSIVVVGECVAAQRTIAFGNDRTLISEPHMNLESLKLTTADLSSINHLFDQALHEEQITYTLPVVDINLQELVDVPAPPQVCVNVLGTICIEGGVAEIERSRSIEAVTYLALHHDGVSDNKLKAALWPDRMPTPGTFNTTVSLARRQLGDDNNGVPFVLPVKHGRYAVSENVGTDFDRFEKLFALAKSATDTEAPRLLGGALELVRGKPFDNVTSGYSWAHVEGFIARAETIIADAAHVLAQIYLNNGDAAMATWAARKGLLAAQGYEVLYRDLMLACEIDGNLAALETIMAELNTLLDVVDPDDNLESETTALYHRLRQRRASVSAR